MKKFTTSSLSSSVGIRQRILRRDTGVPSSSLITSSGSRSSSTKYSLAMASSPVVSGLLYTMRRPRGVTDAAGAENAAAALHSTFSGRFSNSASASIWRSAAQASQPASEATLGRFFADFLS
eukprot:scaffold10674_cov62-Phaeocystis_antarctica.AAC.1